MVAEAEYKAVADFVYKEARLADESRYDEWEGLWTDDAIYWIPATAAGDVDPTRQLSHLYDNRARIATRVKMLKSGLRYSQSPISPMRRVVSNLEVEKTENGELIVGSNFMLVELSIQASHELHIWAGRTIHKLRWVEGELKMCFKKVTLVNAAEPLPNLTFLI
ncbi:MAG: aromatic-ring-hydroxylating dioxygenase subunit beta [Candidatus Binatia bacterium]